MPSEPLTPEAKAQLRSNLIPVVEMASNLLAGRVSAEKILALLDEGKDLTAGLVKAQGDGDSIDEERQRLSDEVEVLKEILACREARIEVLAARLERCVGLCKVANDMTREQRRTLLEQDGDTP